MAMSGYGRWSDGSAAGAVSGGTKDMSTGEVHKAFVVEPRKKKRRD